MSTFFGPLFSDPWYEGITQSQVVPVPFTVGLDGRPYIIDTKRYSRNTIEVVRQAFDPSGEPGEQTLSIEGLWKRSADDWSLGAGQDYWDSEGGIRNRFRASKGIDVFTPHEMCLLPDTEQKDATSATNLTLLVANGHVYYTDDTALLHTDSPTDATWTGTSADIQAGDSPTTVHSITTDGTKVYAALGANGIHQTTIGSATSSSLSTQAATLVGYANGRLLAANANVLYEISSGGSATTLDTRLSTAATYVDIVPSPAGIFVGLNNGDRGEFCYIGFDPETGALAVPLAAGTLNDGELLYSLRFYQGRMIIGTSRGLRLGDIVQDRGIAPGPVIETTSPVEALTLRGEFCWFGMSNYDATSTGLGRADLSTATTDPLVPAYASDLMATTQGATTGVVTFGEKRYFAVDGVGYYGETDDLVASGDLYSGWVSYSTVERKVISSVEVRHDVLAGQVDFFIVDERGVETDLGVSAVQGTTGPPQPFTGGNVDGERFEVHLRLTRDETDATTGPCGWRWTIRSLVAVAQSEEIIVPVILYAEIDDAIAGGEMHAVQQLEEFQALKALEASRRITIYQEGTSGYAVSVRAVGIPEGWTRGWNDEMTFFETTVRVRLVTLT